jgi:hypothetical protein
MQVINAADVVWVALWLATQLVACEGTKADSNAPGSRQNHRGQQGQRSFGDFQKSISYTSDAARALVLGSEAVLSTVSDDGQSLRGEYTYKIPETTS